MRLGWNHLGCFQWMMLSFQSMAQQAG